MRSTRISASLIVLSALLPMTSLTSSARAQDIAVTLLGTSPLFGTERLGPSTLVQAGTQTLLFDSGWGVQQRLSQVGVNASQIDAVFLTHLHSDHVVGIPELWLMGWLTSRRSEPWEFLGPTGTVDMTTALKAAFSADIRARVEEPGGRLSPEGAVINARDIKPGVVYERDGVRVTAILVDHRAIAPAFGYRIDYRGRSVVLSGDTQRSPNLVQAATGADLLIHEVFEAADVALTQNPVLGVIKTFHTDGAEAGEVFQLASPRLAVYSHIILVGVDVAELLRRTRTRYRGPLEVGEDLMRFVVGDSVSVVRR